MLMGACASISSQKKDCWLSNKKINPNQVDLSHFKIVAIIGSGGFAKVFKAVNRITGETVAIKVMDKSRVAKSKTFYKSVWTERNIMCTVKSDFLLELLCSFQSYFECYLVVPFMAGSDFTHHSRSHYFLNEEQVKFYFCQLVLAVEVLHARNIVHRDIKPRNMLLDFDGNIKLCDFGLSYQFKEKTEFLKNTAGTDSYNAPEMLRKFPYRFSVDIWSMGISLFEMLKRKRPFKSDKHMFEQFEGGKKVNFDIGPKCSADARNLIERMLEWEVRDRIGCGEKGVSELREHDWLRGVDWGEIERKERRPPFVPREEKRATRMVDDNVFERRKPREDEDSALVDSEVQIKFKGFEYNADVNGGVPQPLGRLPARKNSEKRLMRLNLRKVFRKSMDQRNNF